MTYQLIFTNRAVKDIEKLDGETKKRIGEKLKEYAKDPIKNAKKLSDPRIGTYRFRIGEYRVIFDLDGNIIVVLRIGHRKKIYKR